MTCDLTLRDFRSIARIVNLAHRFNCRCIRVDATAGDESTQALFAFDGPTLSLSRLRAQIDRLMDYETRLTPPD